ncbi:hypothetical protein Tco_1561083 [Tanacetum coccineum]
MCKVNNYPLNNYLTLASETLQQIYVPKWNVINDSALDDPEVCRSVIDQLAPPRFFSQLRGMNYDQLFAELKVGAARQTCLSAELSPKEAEAAEAIRLRSQVSVVEAAEAARVNKLNSLKERNLALEGEKSILEGQVATLESTVASKDTELASVNTKVAKLSHDLSSLQLSCDELSIKAASLKSQKDSLTDQVSVLETTCSGLCDQVSGYEIFKEQYEVVQDEQVKILSDRIAELDSELMGIAVHLDEEFYPRFLTTIAGRRWISSCGFRLAVMKCLQSQEYAASLGTAIGLAIEKGMQTRLVAGIDHGKAERGLAEVAAFDPFVEESVARPLLLFFSSEDRLLWFSIGVFLSKDHADILRIFTLLFFDRRIEIFWIRCIDLYSFVVFESQKDARIASIMDSLCLDVPFAETLEHPLSSENLVGEAGVPATAATTIALSASITTANVSSILPISVADYKVLNAEPQPENFSFP